MNLLSKKWIVIWLLVAAGLGFSVWDYANYRKIETENFGHGPGDKIVSWKLDKLVQTKDYRLKYPDDLQGVKVDITIKYDAKGTLKDWEDKEIALMAKNEQLFGERGYENTERTNMTVIRFQRFDGNQTYMVSRYLAKKELKLVKLEFGVKLEEWQIMEGNIREMARTLVLL